MGGEGGGDTLIGARLSEPHTCRLAMSVASKTLIETVTEQKAYYNSIL